MDDAYGSKRYEAGGENVRIFFLSGLWLSFYALDVGGEGLFTVGILLIVLAYTWRMIVSLRRTGRLL